MRRSSIHALIIGGGTAGPALSLFLEKAGISSAVYEAHPYTEGVGGGLSLAPNGMNVLDELGLAEKIKARGTLALEMCFRSETGRVLARIDNGSKKYGQPAVALRRADLHDVLVQEMERHGLAITYKKLLTDVRYTRGHEKVVAHFADGKEEFLVVRDRDERRVGHAGRSPRGSEGAAAQVEREMVDPVLLRGGV